ncbi:LysR family transcriptional regulator [Kutzneria sp. NPDC051319]|uniref:LysR family transcriptional regulator n=1 Tax=Kutzneria sp. NPDC051319 TaxID=3155047 RepID=UPI00341D801F
MDLNAVRTFVVATDEGQLQEAGVELGISQQAVSKRIAALEKELGVRLFTRTARGIQLTADGQAFLPHARALLDAADRAVAAVRPGVRPLRVDVLGRRSACAALVQEFHRQHPEFELEVVTLPNGTAATAAVRAGEVDAAFCGQQSPPPEGVRTMRVDNEPLHLLVGLGHELAAATELRPEDLVGQRIWIPGIVPGAEWGAYYEELAAAFDLSIDAEGPNFGTEHMLDRIADTPSLATFFGTVIRLPRAEDLRLIPVRDPTPVYPHSLIWRADNHHPGLAELRRHLDEHWRSSRREDVWTASWAA